MTKPKVRYTLKRSTQKGRAPPKLFVGELAANVGADPPTIWIGTPAGPQKLHKLKISVDELERLASLSFRHAVEEVLDRVYQRAAETRGAPTPITRPPPTVRC